MPRKYTYKPEYTEKNPKITHRRCRMCKNMKEIFKMENSLTCKPCYILKHGKKRCKKCSLLKFISEFHKNYQYEDGYLPICNECRASKYKEKQKEYSKKYYQKNKDNWKKYNKNNKVDIQERIDYYDKNMHIQKYIEYQKEKDPIEQRRQMNKFHSSLRRSRLKNACPKWVDLEEIKRIYANCPPGYHVDHIIPLTHPDVCGLHVPWNLQYLPAEENIRKSNNL